MINAYEKKLDLIKEKIINLKQPEILELGVQNGRSTKMFLEICNLNDGYLTSIDIEDCSSVSNDKRWNFIHSSDDNFELIDQKIQHKYFDVFFIDSYHEPNHVKKVFYHYFKFLKKNSLIFVDDVFWLPYVKGAFRDNDFVERINRLTFEKIIEIYNENLDNLTLDINFQDSGLAILKKIGNNLKTEKKIKNRLFSIKNIIKNNIFNFKPKN